MDSKKTEFIEKGYIVASILNVKNKYFGEQFVDYKELSCVTNVLQHYLIKNNVKAIITNDIDTSFYKADSSVVTLNKNSLQSVVDHYQGYCSLDALKIIWDEKLVLNLLINFKTIQLSHAEKLRDKNSLEK